MLINVFMVLYVSLKIQGKRFVVINCFGVLFVGGALKIA